MTANTKLILAQIGAAVLLAAATLEAAHQPDAPHPVVVQYCGHDCITR